MEILRRWAPLLLYAGLALAMQLYVLRWLAGWSYFANRGKHRAALLWAGRAVAIGIALVPIVFAGRMQYYLPSTGAQWALAAALLYGAILFAAFLMAWTGVHETDLARRKSVRTLVGVAAITPVSMATFGILKARSGTQVEEVPVRVKNLPRGLDGLRIVQLTDIHYGAFFGESELHHAVELANETKPHLAVVTGDLITRRGDRLREAIRVVSGLRAEAGVYGCHGNHEIYARCEHAATLIGAGYGMRFLRNQAADLRFGDATLRLAGIDYQPLGSSYLAGAPAPVTEPGGFNLLLSHNPDLFPRAAALGYDLTLAGHTHGGQVNVEILHENVNVARFFTPFTRGWYEMGKAGLYVSSGLGTVGAPVRLGAPPEVSLIRLCAI